MAYKTYADFSTQLAVSWFGAGIIAPLITSLQTPHGIATSILSLVASYVSLQLAIYFNEKTI